MTTPTTQPHHAVPFFVPLLNPLVRGLLRFGTPMGPNILLTVRGRRSGLPRTFPVAELAFGERRFVAATFGETAWVHNLRAAGEATVVRHGREEPARAVELTPEEAGPILDGALSHYLRTRFGAAFLGRYFGLPRTAGPADFVEAARRHPVFELA